MTESIQMHNGDFLKNYPEVTRVEVINGCPGEGWVRGRVKQANSFGVVNGTF